jgi:O-antigen ligase
MGEGIDAFMAFPLTGVGAGQFKNYNPPERKERWRETHNALIQVAAETGIAGLVVFAFLIVRGATAAASTRRLLARPRKKSAPDPLRVVMTDEDRQMLYAYTAAMTAGLVGWFTCALFASVAYSWTFYYLLALIVAARELARARLTAARAMLRTATDAAVPADAFSRPTARGIA